MKNIIAGLIFFIVGGIVLFFGYSWYKKAKATEKWPTTEGIVLTAEVNSHQSDGSTMYKPLIEYKYSVNGKEFKSPKYSYAEYSSSNSDHAYEVINKYPKGERVTVFYNPEKHYDAVLEPGTSFIVYVPLILGAIFSLVGFLVLIKPVLKLIFLIFAT